MSLFTAEATQFVGIFADIGAMVLLFTVAWIFYAFYKAFMQYWEVECDRVTKYSLVEMAFLEKEAKNRGLSLQDEFVRREMLRSNKPGFKDRLHKKIIDDFFKENTED